LRNPPPVYRLVKLAFAKAVSMRANDGNRVAE